MGFLNMQDKTRKTLDEDERLHSGDLRVIDQEGFLYITGIIKGRAIRADEASVKKTAILRSAHILHSIHR